MSAYLLILPGKETPWNTQRSAIQVSCSRHSGAAGKGPLHRLLQLARMEVRQSPRHLRVQEPGPIRHASSLLLDRRPRSRTGNRSPAAIRKGRPARMESACRWLAVRQVQPDEPEARRFAPDKLRLSDRGQRAGLEDPRRDGSDRERTWL